MPGKYGKIAVVMKQSSPYAKMLWQSYHIICTLRHTYAVMLVLIKQNIHKWQCRKWLHFHFGSHYRVQTRVAYTVKQIYLLCQSVTKYYIFTCICIQIKIVTSSKDHWKVYMLYRGGYSRELYSRELVFLTRRPTHQF